MSIPENIREKIEDELYCGLDCDQPVQCSRCRTLFCAGSCFDAYHEFDNCSLCGKTICERCMSEEEAARSAEVVELMDMEREPRPEDEIVAFYGFTCDQCHAQGNPVRSHWKFLNQRIKEKTDKCLNR